MILDFNTLEETSIPHFKGGEGFTCVRMFSDGKCRIMKGRLLPHSTIGLHTHETNSEVLFLTRGVAQVLFDDQIFWLHEGEVHYCPQGHSHSLINQSEEIVEFSAVVPEQ